VREKCIRVVGGSDYRYFAPISGFSEKTLLFPPIIGAQFKNYFLEGSRDKIRKIKISSICANYNYTVFGKCSILSQFLMFFRKCSDFAPIFNPFCMYSDLQKSFTNSPEMYPNLKIYFMAFRVQIINKKKNSWLGREGGLRGWDRVPTLTVFFMKASLSFNMKLN